MHVGFIYIGCMSAYTTPRAWLTYDLRVFTLFLLAIVATHTTSTIGSTAPQGISIFDESSIA